MEETSAETRDHHRRERQRVVRRESQPDEAKPVDGQPEAEKFLATEAIRQHAHRIARQEVGKHHQRDEESG